MELKTCKFCSLVMKAVKGSGVVTEPGTVEGMSDGAAFLVGKSKEFHVVCHRVDHGECQNCNRLAIGAGRTGQSFGGLEGRLRYNPWSDEIDMDLFPRISVMMCLDREESIFLALLFVMLAGGTDLYMLFHIGGKQTPMEMLGDGLCGMRFTRMGEHRMVPGDDLRLERLGSNNLIVKIDNWRAAGDLGVVFGVGAGEALELGIGLLVSTDNVESQREGIVISVICSEEFIQKVQFIGRLFCKGLVT